MPDSSSGDKKPKPQRGEMSMEGRLMLALALMGGIIYAMPYFYQWISPPQAAKKKADPPAAAAAPAPQKAAAPAEVKPAPPPPATAETPATVAASSEQNVVVETSLYRIEFSNRGGVVRSWRLKKYFDHSNKPVELVNDKAVAKVGYPFSWVLTNQKLPVDLNQSLFAVKQDGLNLSFEFSNGKVRASKKFQFRGDRYLSTVETQVTDSGSPVEHLLGWRGGFGDITVPAPATLQHAIYYNTAESSLEVHDSSEAKDGVVTNTGSFSFAGLEDMYFTAVFLPENSAQTTILTYSDSVANPMEPKESAHVGAAVGGRGVNNLALFVGPKDLDILRSINPKLEQVVDWGWFGFIAKPVFLMINWLNNQYINNYGWSIIIVTIFINMALLPLKLSSLKSMKKMSVLQPQIQAINDRFRAMKLNDPRRQKQNEEIMALYTKHGVNPLGGCIPLALQMPFLFAFFKVFSIAIEMRGAEWLWVKDLSQPETFIIRILPLTMIGTQFWLQKMTPTTGTGDPMQQKMMQFMPLVFGFMFYGSSSGLMLYWLTGNIVAIAQQWFFNKTAVVDGGAPPPKKSVRK